MTLMISSLRWRILKMPASSGAANMAVDEAILEAVAASESPPTLRLYAWDPPCLSVGYAQPIDDVDAGRLGQFGWDLVRRPTGGRALLHVDELTYTVVAPEAHSLVVGGVLASYRRLSRALLAALRLLGLEAESRNAEPVPQEARDDPVCFQVPSAHEITVGGKKLVGSAQLRRRGCVLQHGSIPLHGDIARVCQALRYDGDTERLGAAARLRARATTVEEQLGRSLGWEEASAAVALGFQEALGLDFDPLPLTPNERSRSDTLCRQRYTTLAWTQRI
jgi:lipoate-protein ligase A